MPNSSGLNTSRADTARRLFAAYHGEDRATAERILSENFTFTSPYDDHIDRQDYFRRCWPTSRLFKRHDLERVVEAGNEVIVTYLCQTQDGKSFRNTEIMRFEGARISEVAVYFGASYHDGAFEPMRPA